MKVINKYLNNLVCPEIRAFHRSWSAFRVCGYTGLVLAILLAMTLVVVRGLSPWVMAAIIASAVATFFGLAMLTKIITGGESLTYYHHEIAVMMVVAVLLVLLRQPVLPYLDVTLIGIGAFLVCGRIGCLMVGCCHGKPHSWGVCYREEHAAAGFPRYFKGVRLFPIQLVESLWVFGVVLVGAALILTGSRPGEALAWYVIAYDIGRFFFEFVRGDVGRPYRWGFSEAQWTSLLLSCFVVGLELAGLLAFRPWHIGAAAGLVLAVLVVTLNRRFRRTAGYELLHPHHIREVAEAINLVSSQDSEETAVQIGCTSLGIRISAGKIKHTTGELHHYALSSQNSHLTPAAAGILSRLILHLKPGSGPSELLQGDQDIFHLVIYPQKYTNIHRNMMIM